VGHSIVDEIDTLKKEKAEEVWRKIVERTRQTSAFPNSIGVVTTPDYGKHGFAYSRWGLRELPKDYELIKAKTTDNKFLPPEYVEQIRSNYDDVLAELYILGEFVNLNSHTVYHFFDRHVHALKESPELNHYHIGLDFNVGGCCAAVCQVSGREIYIVDEFVSHDTYDIINNLNKKFKGKQVTLYPDATGRSGSTNAAASDVQLLSQAGYRVDAPQANPLIRDRVNSVNGKLSKGELFIDLEKCPNIVDALESQAYVKGEPEKFDVHPAIDDWVDSLGYFIHRKFPFMRPHSNIRIGGI
jgi:hypothetical protein